MYSDNLPLGNIIHVTFECIKYEVQRLISENNNEL